MTQPIHELNVAALGRAFRARRLTARQVAEHFLGRIGALDWQVNSFIAVTRDLGVAEAEAADAAFSRGEDRGPLQGIPYAVKDIFEVRGIAMTCNSHVMEGYISDHTAHLVAQLRRQGAVLLGKLNTHEFALGGPSSELPFPPARNPWNTAYFTGASSSGSAAAVAAGLVPLAFGSDTSGSIRGPASFCGVVGFKPSYGLVSCHGIFPLSYSMDHVGPLATTAEDCAIAMQAVIGHDPRDVASIPFDGDFLAGGGGTLEGLKVGVMRSYFDEGIGLTPPVRTAIEAALGLLVRAGARLVDVAMPPFAAFNAAGRVIMMAEAFAIHREALETRAREFGRYTYQRISQGAFLSAADYVNAQRQRLRLTRAFAEVAACFDVVIGPGSLTPPPRLDAFPRDWPPPPALTASQTILANVTGCPALSVPIGFTDDGLPLGMQIMAMPLQDARVLAVAGQLQALLCLGGRRSPIFTAA